VIQLNKKFWNDKYLKKEHRWDVGHITTPLKEYFNQMEDKKLRILIPGCGNSYEAEYLFNNGFKNIFVVDYSEKALSNFKKRVPDFPSENLLCIDFFDLNMELDVIIEQTFFCAIDKQKRGEYALKMNNLLSEKGKLVGLLFDDPMSEDHPPFGGNKEEYKSYFKEGFNFKTFEKSHNSIKERSGRELFMILERK
tara:strand:- start:322 stop:906 length:585 start_codon:yes stop_codon:yes gene_type:complete